jgi:hypothetical protein
MEQENAKLELLTVAKLGELKLRLYMSLQTFTASGSAYDPLRD